ncbi:hypothetical protein [Apilactobacillus micheneri]|uniref:hypothetical protein n=1 Tax=Apilactobacillus micheneri TaxID=1899430 RepID=UPI00112A8AE7|nr:hypothetical protein [Apilactobacillus micheneri]TPR50757.1 hypothetical protein DY126_06830 [Apilactobacillus micheneri]
MNKIKTTKLILASLMFGSLLAPSVVASADTNNVSSNNSSNVSEQASSSNYDSNGNFNIPSFDYGTTHSLSLKQQKEFNEIKASNLFSQDQLNEIVKEREANNNPSRISFSSAKSMIRKAASFLGKHVSLKVIDSMADAITDYKDKEQDALQHVLVKYLHANSTVAYWIARTVVFTQA